MDADVVVIGAGALGLSTALHCALAGRSVIVVDRHEAGSQASGRAAGLFKSVQADELRTRLARRSIELALGFAGWAGEPLEVERSGSFLLARTPAHADYLRRELAQSAGLGRGPAAGEPGRGLAEQVSYCTPARAGIRAVVPGGRVHRGADQPDPGLRRGVPAARARRLPENEPVVGDRRSPAARSPGCRRSGRSITARAVVDAAGAWVAQVASLAGGAVPRRAGAAPAADHRAWSG